MSETLRYEVYKTCGCTSLAVQRKRHLPGYCPTHGTDREMVLTTDDPEIDGLTVADDGRPRRSGQGGVMQGGVMQPLGVPDDCRCGYRLCPVPCSEYERCEEPECSDRAEHCAYCDHTRGCYERFYAEPLPAPAPAEEAPRG